MAQQLVNAIQLGSLYMLFALGLTLSWSVLNVLNLAHGSIFMSGALVAWVISTRVGVPLILLLPVAFVFSGFLALLLELFAYRPIRRRLRIAHAAEMATLIASIAAASIPVAVASRLLSYTPQALPASVFQVQHFSVFGLQFTDLGTGILVLSVVVTSGLAWFVRYTRQGRALRALAFDPYAAQLLGISHDRMAAATMFVSGALAGTAGLLLAMHLTLVDAYMGDSFLLKAFAIITLAGVGSVGGVLLASYLLAFAETLAFIFVSPNFKDAIPFLLIMVLLIIRPQGLFSRGATQRA